MKKYKVIAGCTWSDRMQKNYSAGEVLDATMFNDGEAERRVKEGWIAEIIEVVEQPKTEAKKGK